MTRGASASSAFPLRVGAIDAGTNAIRFVAAEFAGPTRWVELEYQRVPVRLGHRAFLTGRLDEETMAAAAEAVSLFRRSMDHLGLARHRAVATSAVRESRNGGELVERIRRECGISLEPITGDEECRLVWKATKGRVDMGRGRWLLADLGGGSLELALVSRRGVHRVESHTIGTVRLLEELGEVVERDPGRLPGLVAEHTSALRLPDSVGPGELAGLLATGGNIETLAELAGAEADPRGARSLPLRTLRRWIDTLSGMSVEERVGRLGLGEDRADVILPAAVVYERVAALAGVREVGVPGVGVKEGLLLDLVEAVSSGHG